MSTTQPTAKPIEVSWGKETDGEPGRDFVGVIAKAEYPYKDPASQFEGEQIRLLIYAEQYEKLQPIWLPPGNKKGTKFVIFRTSLMEKCPIAWREILPAVQKESDPIKQLQAFCAVVTGMSFHFQDMSYESVYAKPGQKATRLTVPIEYKGRVDIPARALEATAAIQESKVSL